MTTAIIPASNESPDTNPVGTGPYKYVSRSPQENFIVEKYDGYWGTPANIDQVIFKVCANADSIVMDLQGGSIDMFARLTTTQASQLGDQFNVLEGTMNLVQAMYLNNAQAPFDSELVRRAFCYAVDRQEIMDLISTERGRRSEAACSGLCQILYAGAERHVQPGLRAGEGASCRGGLSGGLYLYAHGALQLSAAHRYGAGACPAASEHRR